MTLRCAAELLRDAGVENPWGDAGLLLSELCGVSRASLPYSADAEYSSPEFEAAVRRRAAREPLQYILGRWWFRDCELFVSPDCLIPRAETELLAELAIKELPEGGRLLDLCTGSGCVALSVLAERADVSACAADISEAALGVAEKNRAALGLSDRCGIVVADVTCPAPMEIAAERYDVITANPPYISSDEMRELEPELSFEPEMALTDGKDGMSIVRGILENYPDLLSDNGILAIEIGSGEGAAAMLEGERVGLDCRIVKDLAGLDRILVCKRRRKA